MWAPLTQCDEFRPPSVVDEATLCVPATRLEPVDYRILTLLFRGWKTGRIAKVLRRSLGEVAARVDRSVFRKLQAEVEAGVVQQILVTSGTEPVTIAKAAAPAAMRRIVKLSSHSQDPRVQLGASKSVLQYAGVEPPRRLEITTPDRVLDQMTASELARFATERIWPERFRDLLRAFLPGPAPTPAETLIETTATPAPETDGGEDEAQVGRETAYRDD
jgi:hypothetical protein